MPHDLAIPGAAVAEITSDDAEIARLATLPSLAYERERKAAAERLGIGRVAILDRLVGAERTPDDAAPGQGRALALRDPDPWPEPVDGAELLDGLAAAVRRYVVLNSAEADATALWALGAHAFDAWVIFPRLMVTAPEKGCGKSTLLDALSRMLPRPLGASNITAAALFRVIEAARPCLMLDEADTFCRDNEDLRGVLDAGHRRDGAVIRTVGDDHEPRQFSAWAPVALAGIGRLPGTIEDRSVIIRLRRRRPDEIVESLRLDRAVQLDTLTQRAWRWAMDYLAVLRDLDPEMPPGIFNRAADNWRPLLAIADVAGGDWPERARRAAAELTGGGDDESSARVLLLGDIRGLFEARGADRVSSEELVSHLVALDERPWPEFRGGKPISKTQVARLLKPFGVSSGTIRLDDGHTAKGYHRSAFDDAFARYLPSQNVTPSQPAENKAEPAIPKRHNGVGAGAMLRFENPEIPSNSAPCDGVTFPNPQNRADGASRCPKEADEWML